MFYLCQEYDLSNPDSLPHAHLYHEMNELYEKVYKDFEDKVKDKHKIKTKEFLKLVDDVIKDSPDVERWRFWEVIEAKGWKKHFKMLDDKITVYFSKD